MVLSTDQSRVIVRDGNKIIVKQKTEANPSSYKIKILQENANFVIKFGRKQLCYMKGSKKVRACDKQKIRGTWDVVKKDFTYFLRQNNKCVALITPLEKPKDSSELTLKPCTNDDVIQVSFLNSNGDILELDTMSYAVVEDTDSEYTIERPMVEQEIVDLATKKKTIQSEINGKDESGKNVKRTITTQQNVMAPSHNNNNEEGKTLPTISHKVETTQETPTEYGTGSVTTGKVIKAKTLQVQNMDDDMTVRPNDFENKNMIIGREKTPVLIGSKSSTGRESQLGDISLSVERKNKNGPSRVKRASTIESHNVIQPVNADKSVIITETRPFKTQNIESTSEYQQKLSGEQNDYFSKKKSDFAVSLDRDLEFLKQETPASDTKKEVEHKVVVNQAANQKCYIDEQGGVHCH